MTKFSKQAKIAITQCRRDSWVANRSGFKFVVTGFGKRAINVILQIKYNIEYNMNVVITESAKRAYTKGWKTVVVRADDLIGTFPVCYNLAQLKPRSGNWLLFDFGIDLAFNFAESANYKHTEYGELVSLVNDSETNTYFYDWDEI